VAPSQKRKRKPLPKRPCPCCGSLLTEKTIERHASGTHVPTRINVTLAFAAAAQKQTKFLNNLSGDSSANGLDSDLESTLAHKSDLESVDPDPTTNAADADHHTFDDNHTFDDKSHAKTENVEKIVQSTWLRCRSRDDEYESEVEDTEESEEDGSRPKTNAVATDSDIDSEYEGEGMRIRNGLGMDDLIDEDLQRIIAEFSAFSLFSLSS
jgi:hypothetical protein